MLQEVAIRAKLYGDYDSDGLPEVSEYVNKPSELKRLKTAPAESSIKHKRIASNKGSEGTYAPIRDENSPTPIYKNSQYTTVPRTRTNTIN